MSATQSGAILSDDQPRSASRRRWGPRTSHHRSPTGPVQRKADQPALPGLWLGLAVVALACAVWSFEGLRRLAEMSGVGEPLSWLFPITIDVAGAVGTRVWLANWAAKETRSYARALALATLTLSVVGNGLSHAMEAYNIVPHWTLIASLSAVPPAVLAAMVHLAVMVSADRSAIRIAQPEPDPETTRPDPGRDRTRKSSNRTGGSDRALAQRGGPAEPAATRARAIPSPRTARGRSGKHAHDQDLVQQLRTAYPRTGEAPTRNAVMRMFAVGTTRATRLVRLWQADQPDDLQQPARSMSDAFGQSSPVPAAA